MTPYASLSLDLDNKWSYLKTHGESGWELFPSYFDVVVPRVLNFLEKRHLKITVFVVGQDAALTSNAPALRAIAAGGHELGNHSFHHEPWLHLYTEPQVEAEIASASEAIERVTGQRPVGFRGPGFSVSETVLRVLARQGYRYDASTFPTYLGPLARAYYFLTARLTAEERRQRRKLFGGIREGFRPLRPYRWQVTGELLEIPVTTLPCFRLPFHLSYILYLSTFSAGLGLAYFRTALALCRTMNLAPSVLLHPLDFLAMDDCPELRFFPAMKLPLETKLRVVGDCLGALSEHHRVITMGEHAGIALADSSLPQRALSPRAARG